MRTLLILLAIAAALVSGVLIVNGWPAVIDILDFADPTGAFGIYLNLGGLAANLAVVFVGFCVLVARPRTRSRVGFTIAAFVPSVFEAVAALPCFLVSRPGALCGVSTVLVAYASVPFVIIAAIGFVATSQLRSIKIAGVSVAAVFLIATAAAQALLTPSDPAQCGKLSEVTKRSNCLKIFAERNGDENLCRSIEFRTTRFTCLHDIAVEKRQPALWDEIVENSPIAVFESPAVFFRDTCVQNLAYAMHDDSQYKKIEGAPLRASCEAHNP